MAELVAVERTLARHRAGDKVLILCDCESALRLVEEAWRCGELGSLGAAAGRTGGLLAEAITRHRLRMAGAAGADGRQGHVTFVWVKAHGGGIAPNAYADAIAKSHLGEPAEDVPLDAMLPRACVYAVPHERAARPGAPRPEEQRRWMVAADRPLRKIVAERLTDVELGRMRA